MLAIAEQAVDRGHLLPAGPAPGSPQDDERPLVPILREAGNSAGRVGNGKFRYGGGNVESDAFP
jgi:hypothetical protein